jgi:hypothetical protein
MNIRIVYLICIIATIFGSCHKDFLDPNPTDRLSENTVWSSPTLIGAALNQNYNDLSYGIHTMYGIFDDNQMLASLSDEVVSDYEGYERRVVFVNGELSPDNVTTSRFNRLSWESSYNYIARANEFLERMTTITVLTDEQKNAYTGEMKTLRAWRYFNLLKHYGGVPLITQPLKLDDDFQAVRRSTIQETVDFITTELDGAISLLPEQAAVKGRIDKGVARSFRSRVLLYAASPLYNNDQNDLNKWRAAAAAAKEVMDAGRYSLEMDFNKYKNMFVSYDPASPEVIFAREHDVTTGTGYGQGGLLPALSHGTIGAGGLSYFTPTQQMVDAYEMKNGKPITDPTSTYDPQDPYKDRDPRFYAFIYHHGAKLNNRTLDYSAKGVDRLATTYYYNPTGYNMRKFMNEARFNAEGTVVLNVGTNDPTPWIHIRYAEILLNYAEAINEAEGPMPAYDAVNAIRRRAGQPDLLAGLSQAAMRERIRNERRVELSFEEHRYWDVRRWKIAEQTENITVEGVDITLDGAGNPTYQVVPASGIDLIRDRVFHSYQYFWPIPRSELLANPNIEQNPGY